MPLSASMDVVTDSVNASSLSCVPVHSATHERFAPLNGCRSSIEADGLTWVSRSGRHYRGPAVACWAQQSHGTRVCVRQIQLFAFGAEHRMTDGSDRRMDRPLGYRHRPSRSMIDRYRLMSIRAR